MSRGERIPVDTTARTGVDSFHLGEFPFGVAADDPPEDLTLTFEDSVVDESTGERIERRCIIAATQRWGLPNWFDTDVVLALMNITSRQTQWSTRELPFSIYQICRELHRPTNDGSLSHRIQESILRLKATTFEYQNGWRKENGTWQSTEAFSLIDNAKLTNTKEFYAPDEQQLIKWNDVVVETCRHEDRRYDWDFYLSLKPTDKRLYRFLDKRWGYMSGLTYDVPQFCTNKLGLTAGQESFKYKQTLTKALNRLRERGFPVEADFKGKGKNLRVILKKTRTRRTPAVTKQPPKTPEPTGLELQLKKRGVTNGAALVEAYPEEKILQAIENFDDRNQQGDKLSPGWLRKAIEEGYGFRQGFVPKAEREAKQKATAAKIAAREAAEARQRAELEAAQQREREECQAFLEALRSSGEFESFQEEALRENAFIAGLYRKAGDDASAAMYLQTILETHWKKTTASAQ